MISPKSNINILNKKIHSFHFFGVIGYILGTILGVVLSSQLGLQPEIVLSMAGIGAATFFGLTYLSKWIAGGETIVYYHHEISILVLCTIALYLLNVSILPYLDITLLGIGVFLAFGRIGCYSVGCCHGRPHSHGVKYGQQHVDAGFTWYYKDVPLMPVQLIESAYVFLTVIAGVILLFNQVQPGTVLIMYTVVYGLMRYILEFFRGDAERPLFQGVSEAQWTSLLLTVITYLMAVINWLPSYNWHLWIMLVQIGLTAITIFYYKKYPSKRLFWPKHIREVAEGLTLLEELNNKKEENNRRVDLYNTNEGLCISCDRQDKQHLKHYTISIKNNDGLSKVSAEKIADIIAIINHHQNKNFNIIEKQNGIYHLLFDEG